MTASARVLHGCDTVAGTRGPGRERGAVAVLFAVVLPVVLAFCVLAIDLPLIFHRTIDMQIVADTAALAAAHELDGTPAGVRNAVQQASSRLTAPWPSPLTYQYHKLRMNWSDSAIEFGTTPRGPWISLDAAVVTPSPNGLLYVKVDTGGLAAEYGEVELMFAPAIPGGTRTVSTRARAVAGRVGIAVTPLAVCAMRPEANRNRNGELEEFGFRRGVAYDLMQLGALSPASANNYLIDPHLAPGQDGVPTADIPTVAPYICTGTLGVARITGGAIGVTAPFPLGDLYRHLNSRFDDYGAAPVPCTPESAPPDDNIKSYTFNNTASVTWMSTAPGAQSAALSTAEGKRWTVAGPDPSPSGTTAGQFGVLWSYAKAVKYAASQPSGGYVSFDTASWPTLYSPGQPKATATYPSTPPYFKGGYRKSPTHIGVAGRRVLNVPLLACPVAGNAATVAGVGSFFMTVPADADHLYAEFAGLVEEQGLRAQVGLFP